MIQMKTAETQKPTQELQQHFPGDNGSQGKDSRTLTWLWELMQTTLIPQCQG